MVATWSGQLWDCTPAWTACAVCAIATLRGNQIPVIRGHALHEELRPWRVDGDPWHAHNCPDTSECWSRHLSNLLHLISTALFPSQWIYNGERNGVLLGMRKPEEQRQSEVENSRTVWTHIEEITERDPTGVAAQVGDPQPVPVVSLPLAGEIPTALSAPGGGPDSPAWHRQLKELQRRQVLEPVGSIHNVAERGLQDPSGELSKEDLSGDPQLCCNAS